MCKALSGCLGRAALVELKLVGLRLQQPALEALAAGLGRSTSLRHVSLKRTRLGDDGLATVAGALAIGSAAGAFLYRCRVKRSAPQKELGVEISAMTAFYCGAVHPAQSHKWQEK